MCNQTTYINKYRREIQLFFGHEECRNMNVKNECRKYNDYTHTYTITENDECLK